MLDYNLPDPGEERRWYITSSFKEYRYLHLQKRLFGIFWVDVHKSMISTVPSAGSFPESTRRTAHEILRKIKVDFKNAVGEVK